MSKQKIKIKLKDIKTVGKRTTKSIFYSWRRLRKSIKTQGYKPENFSYILVYKHEEKYLTVNQLIIPNITVAKKLSIKKYQIIITNNIKFIILIIFFWLLLNKGFIILEYKSFKAVLGLS